MIKYRDYLLTDLNAYQKFCIENFGPNKHQVRSTYLDWLYQEKNKSFMVATFENDIVGIIHNFKAPMIINGEVELVTVLHDLMVDKRFRGKVGLEIIRSALNIDEFVILPGAVGRIAGLYNRLGAIKFDSYWYRKYLFPRAIFFEKNLKYISKYQLHAEKEGLIFGCNKGLHKAEFSENAMSKYLDNDKYTEYIQWRFLDPKAPLTFYVSDRACENTVLFIVGSKGIIPYLRIFYIKSTMESKLSKIINFIEAYASRTGIPIILHTTFECPPLKGSSYKPYKNMPVSFVYTRKKEKNFSLEIPSFSSDISFDGLNPYE